MTMTMAKTTKGKTSRLIRMLRTVAALIVLSLVQGYAFQSAIQRSYNQDLRIQNRPCHRTNPMFMASKILDNGQDNGNNQEDDEMRMKANNGIDESKRDHENHINRTVDGAFSNLPRALYDDEHLKSLEEFLDDLEYDDIFEDMMMMNEDDDDDNNLLFDDSDDDDEESLQKLLNMIPVERSVKGTPQRNVDTIALESALMKGVVPVSAGVGSNCLPGDAGFDPLQLAEKDYPRLVRAFLLRLVGEGDTNDEDRTESDKDDGKSEDERYVSIFEAKTHKAEPIRSLSDAQALVSSILTDSPRPSALILRDYREAEIRHGRLAMLAAMVWPLQEMLDQLLLDETQYGSFLFGPPGTRTLPFFPLFMTLVLMLLGYLDIYAKAIQDRDSLGDAYLPGDCFWDPLCVLQDAPLTMERNMQERELWNGRAAMVAVAAYACEEWTTGRPLLDIPGNALLLEPAYQVPFIQKWLDAQFTGVG